MVKIYKQSESLSQVQDLWTAYIFIMQMAHRATGQEPIDFKIAPFIEQSKKPLKLAEQLELFTSIAKLLEAEYQQRDQQYQIVVKILTAIDNERVFKALLHMLLGNHKGSASTREKQTFTQLLSYIDGQGKFRKTLIDSFLTGSSINSSYLDRLIQSCKSSQQRSESIFRLMNEVLAQKMCDSPVEQINFNKTSLFALKCLQLCENASDGVVQDAIRHLLIVDTIQKGQVLAIIADSDTVLSKIELLGRREHVSGYWYYLLAKLYTTQANSKASSSQKIAKIAHEAYKRATSFIDLNQKLTSEIDKIIYGPHSQVYKLNTLCQLRGLCSFVSAYTKISIKLANVNQNMVKMVERLMELQYFPCFSQLIKVYVELIAHKHADSQFSPSLISSIQQNCLPIYHQSQQRLQCDIAQLQFLSFSFESKTQVRVSPLASTAMDKILSTMMDSRGCKHKQKICNCCQQYIHSTIEKQYDHEFNAHEFMSACHLMCREIARVVSICPQQGEIENLKNYLIDNLKWLLNLNESCSPQHRKCINNKIFDLMITFPPLFESNQFLQEVVEDLLVNRLPASIDHLRRLLKSYKKEVNQGVMVNESNRKDVTKVGEKILSKLCHESLGLIDKIRLWSMIVNIWENDEAMLSKLVVERYPMDDEHTLAKFLALNKKKLRGVEPIQAKALGIYQKMKSYEGFYSQEIRFIEKFSQNQPL